VADPLARSGDARCPRCGGEFHCGVDDTGPCACTGIVLTPAMLASLRARYAGCLCLDCLAAIAADPARAAAPAVP
jgi:hypothetical protein